VERSAGRKVLKFDASVIGRVLKEPQFGAKNEYRQIMTTNQRGIERLKAQMNELVRLLHRIIPKLGHQSMAKMSRAWRNSTIQSLPKARTDDEPRKPPIPQKRELLHINCSW
jgi:histidinol phosphatase-like enzyme